jgi:hypothetical protein
LSKRQEETKPNEEQFTSPQRQKHDRATCTKKITLHSIEELAVVQGNKGVDVALPINW